jgi:hypothetical protein
MQRRWKLTGGIPPGWGKITLEIYGHLFDVTIESGRSMVDNKIELGRLKYFLVAKDTLKRVVCGKLSSNRLFPLDN